MNRKGYLSNEELSVTCEQIALILRAGLPIHDGVEALCDHYKKTRYAAHFDALDRVITESGSLYEAFKAADVFPVYLVEMTHIGEKTGELENVMEELAAYYDREAKTRHAIQNAVLYPLLLVGMMSVLIAVLILQVFPIFENVFKGLGMSTSSPWMAFAIAAGKGTLIIAGVFILLMLVLLLMLHFDQSGRTKRMLFQVLSPLGMLNRKLYAGRFAATLSMMMKSGYPLEESLELIESLYTDPYVKKKVNACRFEMKNGVSFPEAIEKMGLFEKLHCRMISVGFRAGQTDRVMSKLAILYEEEMYTQISHLVSIIEPSLVTLMSVIIGAIMLSVMLPLLSIMNGIA